MGTRAKGLSFTTAPGARVVAPHGGHVVFAGPFRGYGRLLIIDHGEGYHTLLAGLGRIDVAVNQRLLAGEPIGIMALSGKGNPRLYLELRRNGRPVNPLPWLAAKPTDKVSG
jgi:septal ring factor EnvC (AmiA/AmiB activator)